MKLKKIKQSFTHHKTLISFSLGVDQIPDLFLEYALCIANLSLFPSCTASPDEDSNIALKKTSW